MKHHLPITLALAVAALGLSLTGCDRDEASIQQADAAATFDKAFVHLQRAASGARHVARDPSSPSIEEYRQEQLSEAAKVVAPLATGGLPGDQLAARQIIADAGASQGRLLSRQGGSAATQQTLLASRLTSAASSYRVAKAAAAARSAADYTQHLGELRKLEEQLTAARTETAGRTSKLQADVAALDDEKSNHLEARKNKVTQQDTLERQSFAAKGKMNYDLYVQAAESARQADRLSAAADRASARIDVMNAELAIDQTTVKQLDDQIVQVRAMITDLEKRSKGAGNLAGTTGTQATALATQFNELFKAYVAAQQEQVNKPFDAAIAAHQQGVQQMEGAIAVAGNSAQTVRRSLAAQRAQLGYTLQEAALATAAYRSTLKSLTDSLAAAGAPEAARLADAVKEADARVATLNDQAKASLNAAAGDLRELGDDAAAKQILDGVTKALSTLK